ncbi:MAG: hypothetical protein WC825_04005 [Gallionellaceae bacterium]|jgi:hypothetical protein
MMRHISFILLYGMGMFPAHAPQLTPPPASSSLAIEILTDRRNW